ncbi:MAG: HAMP domain-containing histidine kinase [Butyrivibrio sp.]|nr:HAMP domain-containing histidine kinase [Butyrivibrio sp.]
MKKEYKRRLQAFLRFLIAIVILLMLFFDSTCDFIEGFIEGWSGKDGLATEFGPEITANSVGFILLIFVVISHIAKKYISDPVRKIADSMNKVSSGDLDVRLEAKDSFEFGEIEEAFNNMVAGLKEAQTLRIKNEEQNRQLYAGIAHDLKTPMTMIMGYAKLLKKEDISEDERKRCLTIIEQQIEAANVQLEDMLEYSKFGSASYKIIPEEGNIAALLRGILADMFYKFEAKKLVLNLEIPDTVICKYDHSQMRRVFSNLINNAVRHNPENTTIKVTMTEKRSGVEVVVADNGPFLDEELKAHIFEPYMKGKNGGSGLGLSVAKKIMELHGGMLEYVEDAESEFKRFVAVV